MIGRLPAYLDAKPRSLGKTRWAGAVDCVGGAGLNTTVMSFILRGVALLG